MKATTNATRRQFLRLAMGGAAFGTAALAGCGGGGGDDLGREVALKAPAQTQQSEALGAPTLSCADGATQSSVNVRITAGAQGAAAGFSLQWMPKALYDQYGWSDALLCAAGFSGNASGSRYNLGPNESVVVNIGEFLFDNGASTDCTEALECGTQYLFRAFAHNVPGRDGLDKSDWSADHVCATLACVASCNYSQGYWKTHGPVPTGNNANEWPVDSLMLGSVAYTDMQLLAIFSTPAQGNGLVSLAHQLIAAKLNIAKNGVAATADMAAADALIGALVVPPQGGGWLAPAVTSPLTEALRVYNEGGTAGGPVHCG
jgi:hypothetical protein